MNGSMVGAQECSWLGLELGSGLQYRLGRSVMGKSNVGEVDPELSNSVGDVVTELLGSLVGTGVGF